MSISFATFAADFTIKKYRIPSDDNEFIYLMSVVNFDFFDAQNVLLLVVLTVVTGSFLVQFYYYIFIFRKVGKATPEQFSGQEKQPVSVIICAKNEDRNLAKILPLVLEQNYPEYEVIVVNDNSMDDSEEILALAKAKYPRLQVRSLIAADNSVHGKAVVLGVGIKAAGYDRVVLIDINCRPSANWLNSLSSGFNRDIALGYARHKGHKIIRIANYFDSLFRLGYALNRKPYTASGENDSFRKELFFDKRFNPSLRKSENAEPVFFNLIMNKQNTTVVLQQDAIVESSKSLSLDNWYLECSKDLFLKRLFRKDRHVRLPEIISKTLFYITVPLAIFLTAGIKCLWIPVVGIFLIRLIIQIFVFRSTQKALGEKELVVSALFWDIYSIFIYLYIFMLFRQRRALKYQ